VPLPRAAETAAGVVERIGRDVDRAVVEHLTTGEPMLSEASFRRRIIDPVTDAVTAAMLDIDPDTPPAVIGEARADLVAELVVLYRRAVRDAQSTRRRIERATPGEPEPGERGRLAGVGFASIARRAGFAVAVATATAFGVRRIERRRMQQAARIGGQPLPTRMDAVLRAAVRTGAAVARNRRAADVVEERGEGWALYIRDALKGSDEPCVRVDRRWATVEWLRRHPVEHPNCTREGRPRRLPDGARITLLR